MLKKLKLRKTLKKQHYRLVGDHSGVQVCRWAKKDLIDEGECYKAKFYGIKSHSCCQMSPSVGFCQNKCVHCWRAIELTIGNKMDPAKSDDPKEIIKGCIAAQRKLINGFKGNKKINLKKFKQAQEPMQFAISLTGEPTIYPRLGELIKELRKQGKTSFLVTNGLNPERLKQLQENNSLPTQLYVSMNTSNEKFFNKWHKSQIKDAWKKFNQTLEIFSKLKTRRVVRMTLVKGSNNNMKDEMVKAYVDLIKKADPDFIEVKGYMSVGFARNRQGMGYDSMPTYNEVQDFSKKLAKELSLKILDFHEFSRVILIGKDKKKMKIEI
jgi:tRNA wybutosine-synthesizing protein 1